MTDYYRDRPAGYWIGHPGALLALPGIKGELTRTVTRAASFKTSAGGNLRAYLSARRAPLRVWKCSIPHLQPQEAAVLHDLLMHTDPPFVWVDPFARVTNVLTPAAAGLAATIPTLPATGRQPLEGGLYSPTGAANPSGVMVRVQPAPVVPGMPVTCSAYIAAPGNGYLSAVLLDSAGAVTSSPVTSATVTGTDQLRRVHVTIPAPPVNAAAVELRLHGASVIAWPAVTWTDTLRPYGPGGGAAQVVLEGLDEKIVEAVLASSGKRRSDVSFTVTEVG